MAFLFNVEGKAVYPNDETLLISPFKEIWERDKTKDKKVALEELTFIEFVSSMKKTNPYRQYPENKKAEILMKEVITDENWKPDELIYSAIDKMVEFQQASTTYSYYVSAKRLAEKMKVFFDNVDVNERNEKTGNPIYKPKDITSALNDTEKVLTNLKNLEKKVEEELYEETKTKGGKEISPFAHRNSL